MINYWVDFINFAIATGGFIVAISGLSLLLLTPYIQKTQKIFFMFIFSILTIYIFSDLCTQALLYFGGPKFTPFSKLCLFFESFFSSILLPIITIYIIFSSGKRRGKKTFIALSVFCWVIYVITLVITQFTQYIYYFTPDNEYHRGDYYFILLLPLIILNIINIIALLVNFKFLSKRLKRAFIYYIFIPLICMVVQIFIYGLLLTVIGTSLATMIMFRFVLLDQISQYVKNYEENATQQANIRVLQMRPHFIYNTLTSIYYLCDQDPKKAQQVILNFNTYLRKNFTALANENMILFNDELEHVKAYLAVEQVRFEDMLYVKYDIENTNFRLPSLTLQPIVENSVKYGVDPESDPLQIIISTKETDTSNIITVEDTGPGFDYDSGYLKSDTEKTHVALKNIKERLSMICNGTILSTKRDEGGTITIIEIPKNPT